MTVGDGGVAVAGGGGAVGSIDGTLSDIALGVIARLKAGVAVAGWLDDSTNQHGVGLEPGRWIARRGDEQGGAAGGSVGGPARIVHPGARRRAARGRERPSGRPGRASV